MNTNIEVGKAEGGYVAGGSINQNIYHYYNDQSPRAREKIADKDSVETRGLFL